ncbi:MAG TPA: hypothetical protein VHC96_01040 [Puia sp.]|jgi:anti-sigma factor RsiW|nr:hypothetical protein [Puia sp.]
MITRNNYEEYFLLYVDNELSPADREAVERFVGEHPDLKEEWELLRQCRIDPGEMPSFSGKEDLFRSEAPIHTGNYEEWLLSYIDNELDAPSRQAVIDFIRRHPEKNVLLQQLQRTVSTPDPGIVFPNKELLYRREEKPARLRRMIGLPFAGIAAAALILGAVGLLVFHPFQTDHPVVSAPSNTGSATQSGPPAPVLVKTAPPSTEKKRATPVTPRTVDPYYLTKKGNGQQKASTTRTGDETTAPALALTGPVRPVKVDPVRPAQTAGADPGHVLVAMIPKTIDRNPKIPVTMAAAGDQTQHDASGNMNASFATQALLSQTSYPDDDSPEEATASPRKNKLRGIFRKVTRVLEKPAAREDDDNKMVTIGGFQFALK